MAGVTPPDSMFDKILIANRGEIACRIARTARRMGIKTVAVHSEVDAGGRHVRRADEAVFIGASPPRESYLDIGKIIAAARKTGAQAIHPGYGFLAENAAFRRACDEAHLVFIGPPLAAIEAMGSKSQAKKLMEAAKVPLAPGYHGDDQDPERLGAEAESIGYPVLIKAAAGGGGKGMRLVEKREDFSAALASCKREALANFGDDHVLVEKYIQRPRHIEIQIFADGFGNCVSLFERDCSVQRRHQKVLEEAPAPGMSDERRRRMGEAAIAAAQAVGYVGAGTVEFIATQDGAFFFMEMNTRLQVEHPVTEMITGLDLVEWQLRIAAGQALPLRQEEIHLRGHALEARLYAEDPAKNFLPSVGRLHHLRAPAKSANVRLDAGVDEGDVISPYYDPMIAKLIVWDEDRDRALARMRRALGACEIAGVSHNVAFLSRLVSCPAFAQADLDTGLIEREQAYLFPPPDDPPRAILCIAAMAQLLAIADLERTARPGDDFLSPWNARDDWRLNLATTRVMTFERDGRTFDVSLSRRDAEFVLTIENVATHAKAHRETDGKLRVELDGVSACATAISIGAQWRIFFDGGDWSLTHVDPLAAFDHAERAQGGLSAPMPGRIVALLAEAGQSVKKGAPLLILEAMKMEHTITAPSDGLLKTFRFAVGEQVVEGADLLEFEPGEN